MTAKNSIQIYADSISFIEATGSTLNIGLENVDIGQIIAEFPAEEILSHLDGTAIADYYIESNKD